MKERKGQIFMQRWCMKRAESTQGGGLQAAAPTGTILQQLFSGNLMLLFHISFTMRYLNKVNSFLYARGV